MMRVYSENTLWVTFLLDNQLYCVASDHVASIVVPDAVTEMPGSPPYLLGMMRHIGRLIPVLEMRTLLGMKNLREYVSDFGAMKDMHVDWVRALEESVHNRTSFSRPVDPHKCKFGQWYDHFHTKNVSLGLILDRLAVPHERIHHCGGEINQMIADGAEDADMRCVLQEAVRICHQEIVPLLDRLTAIYQEVNRGILLILRDTQETEVGILVDEIADLIPSSDTTQQPFPIGARQNPYLAGLVLNGDQAMMEISAPQLLYMDTNLQPPVLESTRQRYQSGEP